MKIKTLLITSALAAVSAFTTNAEPINVTAAWPLGVASAEEIKSEVSNENITATFNIGADIAGIATRDAVNNDKTETFFTATAFQVKDRTTDAEKGNVNDNEYIEFVITPTAGSFVPKKISFYAGNFGFGDGRYSISVFDEDQNIVIAQEETPARPEEKRGVNSIEDCFKSHSISGFNATDKSVSIRINLWNRNTGSGKRIGFKDVIIEGVFYANGDAPVQPEIPDGAVVAPFNYGSFYDVTKAECTVANFKVTDSDQYIENTKKGTIVNFPFYVTEESDLFFYIETGAKDNSVAWLKIYLDNEYLGEHEVKNTTNFAKYDASTVLKMPTLQAGKHVLRIERDEERSTLSYAGNWHIGFYSKDVYDHASISPAYAKFTNCQSADKIEVGWIKDGSSIEYKVFVPEAGSYALNIRVTNHNTGTCTVSIAEEGISVPFSTAIESRSDIRQIALGDINTPGIKTLRLEFTADHQNYIANYDNLGLERTGDVSGIADVEAAEVVAVEYYNLQGVRVEGGARGTLIRVSTDANGSRKAEKVIVR